MPASAIAGAASAISSHRSVGEGDVPRSARELLASSLLSGRVTPRRCQSLGVTRAPTLEDAPAHLAIDAGPPRSVASHPTPQQRTTLASWLKSGTAPQGAYLPLPTRDHQATKSNATEPEEDETGHVPDQEDDCVLFSLCGLTEVRPSLKMWLEDPSSSQSAARYQYFMFLVIMAAVTCAICETVPEIEDSVVFHVLEPAFTTIFTVEISLRWWVSNSSWSFFSNIFNVIDCLATLPGYIDILLPILVGIGTSSLETKDDAQKRIRSINSIRALRFAELMRIVRLLRVLRVANTMRQSEAITVVLKSIYGSLQGIWVLMAFTMVGTILTSTAAYCFEMGVPNTGFKSIPASVWWASSTITAVGYGDLLPRTFAGKVTAVVTMFLGTIIMAVCIAVITNSFTIQYQREMYLARMRKMRREAEESGLSPLSPLSPQRVRLQDRRKSSLARRRRMQQSTYSNASAGADDQSPPAAAGAFGGAGYDDPPEELVLPDGMEGPSEDIAAYVHQLEEMTEALLLSFEALLGASEGNVSPSKTKTKAGSVSRLTLEMLRKNSALWFEHARMFSEELVTKALGPEQQATAESPQNR